MTGTYREILVTAEFVRMQDKERVFVSEITAIELVNGRPVNGPDGKPRHLHLDLRPALPVPEEAFQENPALRRFRALPTLRQALPRLQAFIGDAPILYHAAPNDGPFDPIDALNEELALARAPELGAKSGLTNTAELAAELWPGAGIDRDELADRFNIHQARLSLRYDINLSDALITAAVACHVRSAWRRKFEAPAADKAPPARPKSPRPPQP